MREKKIFLVEDNPDDELLTLDALETNRIKNKVIVARNGVEAIDYIFGKNTDEKRDMPDLPALILLDLNLPKISGLDVLRRIRADDRTRLLPVVILTSSKEQEDRSQGYSLGANSYIRKPVNFDEFIKAVGQDGVYWLMLNEPAQD